MANAIVGEWEYCPDGIDIFGMEPEAGMLGQLLPSSVWRSPFNELDARWLLGDWKSKELFLVGRLAIS